MQLKPAFLFTDRLVLQQGQPVPVWGSAAPGSNVTVELSGPDAGAAPTAAKALADRRGAWMATLPPLAADARPHTLTLRADSPVEEVVLRDVLIGEVWLCSGQSNMQWALQQAENAESELPAAHHPAIRLFSVPPRPASAPQTDTAASPWAACMPESAALFSAVGYFFGLELHRRLGIPVGLINASLGGTRIEAWTDRDTLLTDPAGRAALDLYVSDLACLPEKQALWEQQTQALTDRTRDTANLGFPRGWADGPDPAGDWKDFAIPGSWQSKGMDFSGVFWFRRTVDIPAAWAGHELRLGIGATDKSDITYFNNVPVGSVTMQDRPDAWSFPRVYTVPGGLVKAGRNVVAVRVHSNMYAGGMTGPATALYVECPSRPEHSRLPLAGIWRHAIEANYGRVAMPAAPMGPDSPNGPAALFNGMIAPLIPFALRGTIWYQGESNAENPRAYRTLLPAMIRNWRTRWGQDHFHFLVVQLPNYLACPPDPAPSRWAELREAQTMALDLPDTGMAVTLDLGRADDIHPPNKLDVGNRLAWSACDSIYRLKTGLGQAPAMKSCAREGGSTRVVFEHTGGHLVCRGDTLKGFAVAGEDRRFVWAEAAIESDGQTVRVTAPGVPSPVVVRYAWADNPECNLYGWHGLPAAPFRTDEWEM